MKSFISLVRKELVYEWRSLYQIGGVLAFLFGVSYLIYFFSGGANPELWNLLYWLVFMFLCFFTGSRVFEEDTQRFKIISYQLLHPFKLFAAKSVYLFVLLNVLGVLLWSVLSLLIPLSENALSNWLILLIFFNTGMSLILTFSSFLASQGQGKTLLLTVLVLPLSFPLMGTAFETGLKILNGYGFDIYFSGLRIIIGINLFVLAMIIFLVPLTWKN
ncbi:MAG: heme exporter protein CcmB [Saprospiraceae bacterium]|nr:heme exporter protein CcmB [Candidatus Vicinibacter affinis]MBP6172074.1 heme exporter protein CcmB [Saprospiraceae bacterium]MBK6571132.1 heme exporter protein CcmB [Candidatus Vicinibacter affinis]MBK6822768.1 heme exporter protein CcmB [Candidatus Vicinibacter affinis]MBK7304868.1 heme exporter protein CcmB [Candidatus Vicinibacter affinis]